MLINIIKHRSNQILLGFLFLSFLFRVFFVAHGYPYVFNIDEPALIRTSFGIRFNGWINHFDWPHLNFYLNYIFYEIFIKIRAFIQVLMLGDYLKKSFPLFWNDPFIFYVLSRFLNVVFSVCTGFFIFKLSREVFKNHKLALYSLLIYFSITFNTYISFFALQESALLFFASAGIYYLYMFLNVDNGFSKSHLFISALMIGASASIKYNALIVTLLFPLILVLKKINPFSISNLKNQILFGVTIILVFLLSNASLFKYLDIFWSYQPGKGFLWQLFVNSEPLSFSEYPSKLIENTVSFVSNSSITVILLFFTSTFFAFIKKQREILFFSFFSVILFLLFSRYGRSGTHYFVILYSLIPVVSTYVLSLLDIRKYFRYITLFLFAVAVFSHFEAVVMLEKDTYLKNAVVYATSEGNKGRRVYVKGSELSSINSINNLGFKRYENNSKIAAEDYVLSEVSLGDENLIQMESFRSEIQPDNVVYIYSLKK